MRDPRSKTSSRTSAFFRIAIAISAVASLGVTQRALAEDCLKEAYGQDANCTAEDIAIANIEITNVPDGCSGFGDTFQFDGFLHVVSHATNRYDVGFYLGPNAYTSTDSSCTVTVIDPNAIGGTQDGDVCGDVSSAIEFLVPVTGVTAVCADTNGDGFFDVSTCSTWRQQASSTDCPDEAHALPGTKSKCNCEQVDTTLSVPQCTSDAECDDGAICTSNVCDPSDPNADGFGCVFPNAPSTTICRSASGVCDADDRCTGTSPDCPADTPADNGTPCPDDGQVCTDDVCEGGVCTHPDNSDPCDDGAFCTTGDVCSGGICSGTPLVCDDGKECSVDTCNEAEDKCDFTECEPVIPDGEICRTAGFWSTHAGSETKKGTVTNITQELLDLVGPLQVCGQTISTTSNTSKPFLDGLGLTSALEALCVRVQGDSTLQLYRQLVAAALNCAVTGVANFCNLIIPEFDACSDVCEGTAGVGAPTEGECIALLDCFNNGGEMVGDQCSLGTCASQPQTNCGGDFGPCPDFNGLPQPCVPFEDNCHDQELCNEDIGFCPDSTPATSEAACREAQSNQCTIVSCP